MSRLSLKALQAAAGAAAGEAVYAEDVFSTYVYAGNSSTNQIDNGIDLDGEGGLVWLKKRSGGSTGADHSLIDTERGRLVRLKSNTNDNNLSFDQLDSFNSDGFTLSGSGEKANLSGKDYVSWTFRKQPGFFDVVTYSGNSSTQTISHNLGVVPGMIIIKRYDGGLRDWVVYHRSVGNGHKLKLNSTNAETATVAWNSTTPTDTEFYLGNDSDVNNSAGTYVAYLFAHDAQDFGTDSDESIIKCGSATYGVSGDVEVDLGWEPQWVMYKRVDGSSNWWMLDSMRGWEAQRYGGTFGSSTGGKAQALFADSNNSETDYSYGAILPSGFKLPSNANDGTGNTKYLYVAIRRPHKPAEEFAATDLFDLDTRNGVDDNAIDITGVNFPVDAALITSTNQQEDRIIGARLTGKNALFVNGGNTETDRFASPGWDHQDGITFLGDINKNGYSYIDYFFRRAPGFFDVVAYNTTGSTLVLDHNLGVAPEFMMIKGRSIGANWYAYHKDLGNTKTLQPPNDTAASTSSSVYWNNTSPTATQVTIGSFSNYNLVNNTGILYLFASSPGISKIGSYTGTGSNINVDCGFTSGARLVLVKRTDDEGHWYLWDSDRGIVAGIDPFLELSRNRAQIATKDYIDPLSSGFTITSSASAEPDINASGGSYIFLAIA